MYSRDSDFNQQIRQMKDVRLTEAPMPAVGTATALDGDIDVLGASLVDAKQIVPGAKLDVFVYMKAKQQPTATYRFALAMWQVDDATVNPSLPTPLVAARTRSHRTADGLLPSKLQWDSSRPIRERFTITVPKSWTARYAAISVEATDRDTGPAIRRVVIGALPIQQQGSNGSAAP